MEALTSLVTAINDIVWGPPMLIAILGTGLFLQLRLKFMPILHIGAGFKMLWRGRQPAADAPGEISPYAALMTALAALFWMWMTALVGMATKYAEVLLALLPDW